MDRRLFLVALVAVAVYAPVMGYGYVYEDWNDLESFSRPWPIGSVDPIGDLWRRPTRTVTALSFAVMGTDPAAAHRGNVALHLVNGLLLYAVARPWLGGAAVLVAGVFWLHPAQVESVAYISSRADLVAVMGVLLAVLLRHRLWWCAAAAGLAVLAKETFVMALLIPAAVVYRQRAWRAGFVWAVVGMATVAWLWSRFGAGLDPWHTLRTLGELSRLLVLWVWPVGQTIDHDWVGLLSAPVVIGVTALWGVAAWWAVRHPWPSWSVVLGIVLLFFVPRLVVPLTEGLHEHHLYAPSVVLSLWVGYLAQKEQLWTT